MLIVLFIMLGVVLTLIGYSIYEINKKSLIKKIRDLAKAGKQKRIDIS